MRRYVCVIVILIIGSAIAGCTAAGSRDVIMPATPGSESYRVGENIYNAQCASCHGNNGEGQFPDAPLERDVTGRYGAPPHDDTGHTWHHDDDLLIQVVQDGGMGDPVNFYVMPAFGAILSDSEIVAVISYIKTLWTEEQQIGQREATRLIREQNQQ